jgi:hypothetical protein
LAASPIAIVSALFQVAFLVFDAKFSPKAQPAKYQEPVVLNAMSSDEEFAILAHVP